MTTTTSTHAAAAVTDTILALDLGKYKSVACYLAANALVDLLVPCPSAILVHFFAGNSDNPTHFFILANWLSSFLARTV